MSTTENTGCVTKQGDWEDQLDSIVRRVKELEEENARLLEQLSLIKSTISSCNADVFQRPTVKDTGPIITPQELTGHTT